MGDVMEFEVRNPANGVSLGHFTGLDEAGLRTAIEAARNAQPGWAALSYAERAVHLNRARQWLVEHMDQANQVISDCVGKTRLEAQATEVMPALGGLKWYVKNGRRCLKPHRLATGSLLFATKHSSVHRLPWGVVGIIAPWNYPLGIPMHEIVPALLAGNAVVFKTAPETLPVGKLIADMLQAAGLPEGLFHNVVADGPLTGRVMLGDGGVDKLCFTGSVKVGKLLMAQAAERLVPVSLELGGKDAAIIRADADLDRAAAGVVWAGLSNAGQSCAGIERVYVERSVQDAFLARLKARVEALRVGSGADPDMDIGALCTERQVETVARHVDAALAQGATLFARRPLPEGLSAQFYPPSILTDVTHEMEVMREETFGPVIGVMPFDTLDEAVRYANDSPYGLTASVWTRDLRTGRQLARRLQAGAVTVNDHLISHGLTETPWGGPGASGIGRGHGTFAFESLTLPQVVIADRGRLMRFNPFWPPYSTRAYAALKGISTALFGRGIGARLRGLLASLPLLGRMRRL